MKLTSTVILLSFIAFFPKTQSFGGTKLKSKKSNHFTISENPSREDWKFFMAADDIWKRDLWLHYKKARGKELGDWAWGWRMGWVKVCGRGHKNWCPEILKAGLFDKAAVVRGETAHQIGALYASTQNLKVIKLLEKAYTLKANMRSGKPLFVQQRILSAIKTVGGVRGLRVGRELATSHHTNQEYWAKLNNIQ